MGLELVLLYLGLAVAGVFSVNKGVELYKHSETLQADRYNSCVKHASEIRECRSLE